VKINCLGYFLQKKAQYKKSMLDIIWIMIYGFSSDDKIFIITNGKPFEILEIKNSIP